MISTQLRSSIAVVVAVLGAIGETTAQTAVVEWRAVRHQISGNTTTCPIGGMSWVREGNGKLALLSADKHVEVWSIAQAADGSVDGETTAVNNHRMQIKISGPIGPREFEYLNWTHRCHYKIIPAKV